QGRTPLVVPGGGGPGHRGIPAALPRRSAPAQEHRARRRCHFLSRAARRHQLLAPGLVAEPGAGARQRDGILRGVPDAGVSMNCVATTLAAITILIALEDGGAASLLRHAYLVPVLAAALRFGAAGGALAAAAAILLSAPLVLPEIERSGITSEAVEGLVTF